MLSVWFSLSFTHSSMLKCVCCHEKERENSCAVSSSLFFFFLISHKSIRTYVCTTKKYLISFIIFSHCELHIKNLTFLTSQSLHAAMWGFHSWHKLNSSYCYDDHEGMHSQMERKRQKSTNVIFLFLPKKDLTRHKKNASTLSMKLKLSSTVCAKYSVTKCCFISICSTPPSDSTHCGDRTEVNMSQLLIFKRTWWSSCVHACLTSLFKKIFAFNHRLLF